MAKTTLNNNMVGRKVKVTMGLSNPPPNMVEWHASKGYDHGGWSSWGKTGEVVAAFQDSEGVKVAVAMDDDATIVEFFLTHVALASSPAKE